MKALILTDIQNDFCSGGALAVPDGDAVVPVANRLIPYFPLVVATQDWHPSDHGSFAANNPGRAVYDVSELGGLPQVLWPVHCVQGSNGAAFHRDLDMLRADKIVHKGTDAGIDSYSAFFDNGHRKATELGEFLRTSSADDIFFCGLATDYCVKFSVLDARRLGLKATVILDGCRGVGLSAEDVGNALQEMRDAGARLLTSDEVLVDLAREHAVGTGRRVLAEGRFLRLVVDGTWELAERRTASGVVAVVAVTFDQRLILTDQYRFPVGRRVIDLPAGLAGDEPGQDGEPLQNAARRELIEETGYDADSFVYLDTCPTSAGLTSEVVSLFLAVAPRRVGAGGGVPGERIAVHEVPLGNVREWLTAQAAGGALIDPKVYAGLYLASEPGGKDAAT